MTADNALALAQGRLGPKRRPVPLEHQTQIAIIDLLKVAAVPGVVWHHSPNGGLRTKREAAKLKAMGVLPGFPDLIILLPNGRPAFLEVKREKGGTLSEDQKAFRERAEAMGAPYAVARSVDAAADFLREIGALRRAA